MAKAPKNQLSLLPPEESASTPLMRQYAEAKRKFPDALLLFRIGDFYETFGDDAIKAAQVLGITLTSRNNGAGDTELAGFPHHSLDTYLPRLVRAGLRVAICEQLEKPIPGKVVKRGVTEVVTPGVTISDHLLEANKNNYLASIAPGDKNQRFGISLLDISTGELLVTEGDSGQLDKLLSAFQPAEIIFPKPALLLLKGILGENRYYYGVDDWVYTTDYTREKLLEHFEAGSLKGFGIEDLILGQVAAGAALHYLAVTENHRIQHINRIARLVPDKYVWLDRFTVRNLELIEPTNEGGRSLFDILNRTATPMGARLMRKWVLLPLKQIAAIDTRLDIVQFWLEHDDANEQMRGCLKQIGDVERLISKVPSARISPRETGHLRRILALLPAVKDLLKGTGHPALLRYADMINPCEQLQQLLHNALVEDPPTLLVKGGVIADGYNDELDQYRALVRDAQKLLLELQQREIIRTGIPNLKIGFNNVFGYYLEVTNKYKDAVGIPDDWIRKQTLTSGERYISKELKVLEDKILNADERIIAIEQKLYAQLVESLATYVSPIQHNAEVIATIDCLLAFALLAERYKYVRPVVNEGDIIDIRGGRHPVIEQQLAAAESYVPNDVLLNHDDQQILMITGPNMAGKSALLRQTALICLMAQMGCYVPADAATIGFVDKVFTRVGASDNISSGESTFMVEMNETASIMNNVSDRSLILLDEIGRGTSTFDGISIAWSIAEYLHENGRCRPKTLFATHYHELNELSQSFERIKNFNVAVHENKGKIVFLRRLMPGGSQHSFGIHVAKLAGMPVEILKRANDVLQQLEKQHLSANNQSAADVLRQLPPAMHVQIAEAHDPRLAEVANRIAQLDLSILTPIECMMKLLEFQNLLNDDRI